MKNKVKPFFIRITDDMTPQMVQDAFDKCVDAGAIADESCEGASSRHRYKKSYDVSLYTYFGSDDYGMTYMDIDLQYFDEAQEITLDQLDEWLGLESKAEWDGQGLPPVGVDCEILDINGDKIIGNGTIYHVDGNKFFILSKSLKDYPEESTVNMFDGAMNLYVMWVNDGDDRFRKPETLEQKAERERIENGKAIYDLMSSIEMNHDIAGTPNTWAELRDEWQSVYIQLAESVGYRKQ